MRDTCVSSGAACCSDSTMCDTLGVRCNTQDGTICDTCVNSGAECCSDLPICDTLGVQCNMQDATMCDTCVDSIVALYSMGWLRLVGSIKL